MAVLTEAKSKKVSGILENSRLFSGCEGAVKKALALGEMIALEKDEKMDLCSGKLFVILSGVLTVQSNSVTLNVLEKGSVTGVTGLFDRGGSDPVKTVVNTLKPGKVLAISMEDVQTLVREEPDFAENYIAFLTDRIRFLNRRLAYYTAGNVQKQLAGYLLDATTADSVSVAVNMSKLAAFLNIGRATLYRTLDALEKAGAVKKDKNLITVLSRTQLKEI
ncbi:MAG: Crp/Fnr family transcriptional regulator [Lachnospiraceae bacterium]|nr:Crp/Fnr family transcriptional regulator [Lachnospiraceae bacterium]